MWDDSFETDKEALEEAFMSIETEGTNSFIINSQKLAKEAELELLKSLAQEKIELTAQDVQDMMAPLNDEELKELDQFLLYGVDNDESMTLDTLDGYLHAIAIGPETTCGTIAS